MPCPPSTLMGIWYTLQPIKKHIGFYPGPDALRQFADEVAKFKNSKGAIQFPLDAPLPIGLIKKIVHHRVQKNHTKKYPEDN